MTQLIVRGKHYENLEPVEVHVENGKILSIEAAWPNEDISAWPIVAPGLFDLQINGHKGVWFGKDDLTVEEVLTTLKYHFQYGITRLCPTLITNSHENLMHGFSVIRQACEQEAWASEMVPGFHLEGPYISPEDGPRGASSTGTCALSQLG